MVCPACNYMMDPFDTVCPRCQGKGISAPTSPPAQAAPTAAPPAAAPQTAPARPVPQVYTPPQIATQPAPFQDSAPEASVDVLGALQIFIANPVGGLQLAYARLGNNGALAVGVAFGILFDIGQVFGTILIVQKVLQAFGAFMGHFGTMQPDATAWPPLPTMLKLLGGGLTPLISIALASALCRQIFNAGVGRFSGDVFVAGATLLPIGLAVLLSGMAGNLQIAGILYLFALSYSVMILYKGCTEISEMPESGSALAVPVILLISAWLTKVILSTMYGNGGFM